MVALSRPPRDRRTRGINAVELLYGRFEFNAQLRDVGFQENVDLSETPELALELAVTRGRLLMQPGAV